MASFIAGAIVYVIPGAVLFGMLISNEKGLDTPTAMGCLLLSAFWPITLCIMFGMLVAPGGSSRG